MPWNIKTLLYDTFKSKYNPAALVFVIWNFIIEESNYELNNIHKNQRDFVIKNEDDILPALEDNLVRFIDHVTNMKAYVNESKNQISIHNSTYNLKKRDTNKEALSKFKQMADA